LKLPWCDGEELPKGRACLDQANEIREHNGQKDRHVLSNPTAMLRTEAVSLPDAGVRHGRSERATRMKSLHRTGKMH
jgi:hypothetical protein